jgi:cellulose synthase/poly-beta-1,6-N-acetylglucosamine synthase-like glycosyltransferase
MQAIKYFFGWEVVKTLERAHRSVFCLSGCLTAYRRSVLVELEPILEERNMLSVPIKYGEDRFLTRQILKAGYQTTLTMDAVCRTEAPTELAPYIAQQLRWRRSNLMDYLGGLAHVWRMHPVVAIHFFSLFALLFAYPALLIESMLEGWFWPLMVAHVGGAGVFGLIYQWFNRHRAPEDRVSALSFLPIAFVIPITYAVLPPLALLTLDSGCWETRGHRASETVDEVPVPVPVPVPVAANERRRASTAVHSQGAHAA